MKKKKIVSIVLVLVLIIVAGTGIVFWSGRSEEMLLKENQRYVYAYITSIQGNEITYMEVEESLVASLTESENNISEENEEKNNSEKEEEQEEGRNFPDRGSMPDMENMPDMGNMPDRGNMSGGAGKSDKEAWEFGTKSETITTYIPVGITVHTAADVSTTFSRLASGDLVKMLVEKNDADTDVIEEIWMLQ